MGSSSKKKSLLVVTSTFPRWVGDTDPPFVMELCKRLVNENTRIDVLAPHAQNTKTTEFMNGINVYRYKYFFSKWELLAYEGGIPTNLRKNKWLYFLVPLFFFSQMKELLKLINNNKYDLVHAHWLIPQGLVSVILIKIFFKNDLKVLCTSHGSDLLSFQSFIYKKIIKWVLINSDAITVVSKHMRKRCIDIINVERDIYVCPMGVDLKNIFFPIEGINRGKNRVIFVGRLIESKGVAYLIDAIKNISSEIPDIELLIVGDGVEKKSLQDKCKKMEIEGLVSFYGAIAQDKLPALYSSAAIAVMPSIKEEGLGLVSIEAMACGCAVITTSIESAKDFIIDGISGLAVKPADSSALEEALISLLSDCSKCTQMAMNGRKTVLEKFGWQKVIYQYEEIIESLCQ